MAPSAEPAPSSQEDVSSEHRLEEEKLRFSPEEEATLLNESNEQKTQANKLFTASNYTEAITTYEAALATCPNYLDYEVAVLKSNVAACQLKLEDWKAASQAATEALDALDRLEKKDEESSNTTEDIEEAEEEIVSSGAAKAQDVSKASTRKEDIARIRSKALMRRARARSEQGGWSSLEGCKEDYTKLSAMTNLSAADRRIVQTQLRVLPPRIKAAQEKEMGEMMGKLKQLGNGLLKPFGLSTDNFQLNKDENTGGYSMNFVQGEK